MDQVAFVAEASSMIGMGHVMRCKGLAESFQSRGWRASFWSRDLPDQLRVDLIESGVEICSDYLADFRSGQNLVIGGGRPDLVIFDTYHDCREIVAELRSLGIRTAAFVDHDDQHSFPVDVVIRFVCRGDMRPPQLTTGSSVACGYEWVPLRLAVRSVRKLGLARVPGSVLLSIGGTDPLGYQPRLRSMFGASGVEVKVLGQRSIGGMTQEAIDDFPSALAEATVAVLGCGVSVWEAIHLGTPVVPVVVAPNQADVADVFRTQGLGEPLWIEGRDEELQMVVSETIELLNRPELRAVRSQRSLSLIDGRGGDRLASFLINS